jgi:UDP-N-acetylglucosamine acyltransferase
VVHATASIDERVVLGAHTRVHQHAVLSGDVRIGESVTISPGVIITGPAMIDDHVWIGPYAVIGAPPQDADSWPAPLTRHKMPGLAFGVRVEHGAVIREHSTIHQGVLGATTIGAHAFVMAGTHVAHDCRIGERTTIASFSTLGGFTQTGLRAYLGQQTVTHQWMVIGDEAMVGMCSAVVKDVQPLQKVAGVPARLLGTNTHHRSDLDSEWNIEIVDSAQKSHYLDMCNRRSEMKARWERRHA